MFSLFYTYTNMLFALKGFTSSSLENAGKVLTILFIQLHYMGLHFGLMLNSVELQHLLPMTLQHPCIMRTSQWMVLPGRNVQIQMRLWCFPLLPRTLQHIGNRYNRYIKFLFHFQVAELHMFTFPYCSLCCFLPVNK